MKFFIYLSYWNFLLVVAHLLYSAVCCTYVHFKFAFRSGESHHKNQLKRNDLHDPPHHIRKCCLCFQCFEDDQDQVPWYYLPMWIGHYIAAIFPIPVILLYWALLAGSDDNINWATNLHTHILIGLPGIIDSLFSGIPWRLYHVFISIICGVVYLIFSLIYDLAGGTNIHGEPYIYSSTDYSESPASAIGFIVAVTFILTPFVHFLFWCLFIARTLILYCKIGGGHQTAGTEVMEEYQTRKISEQPLSPLADDGSDKGKRNPLAFVDEEPPQSPLADDSSDKGKRNPLAFVDEEPPQSPLADDSSDKGKRNPLAFVDEEPPQSPLADDSSDKGKSNPLAFVDEEPPQSSLADDGSDKGKRNPLAFVDEEPPQSSLADDSSDKGKRNPLAFVDEEPPQSPLADDSSDKGKSNPLAFVDEEPPQSPP